jgi:hypothetical protein
MGVAAFGTEHYAGHDNAEKPSGIEEPLHCEDNISAFFAIQLVETTARLRLR